MLVMSLSLLHKTRDTPSRVNREVSKSFDVNNWHLLRKGEKIVTSKESGKRILGLMTGRKKRVHFFGKGCCEKCTGVKQQRKRRLKKHVKS
jgi:hypothetical protein